MSQTRRTPDHYARLAKKQGHAARSVYKLAEIHERWRLLRPGAQVLDLGAAPGSWLQYVAEQVGPKGRVIGVDLKAIDLTLPPWVQIVCADVYTWQPTQTFDVVLSDMAPSTMGDHKTDAIRSNALAAHAGFLAQQYLRPGGHLVVKVLEGADTRELGESMRLAYRKLERLRPLATRRQSTELFLIGLHKIDQHESNEFVAPKS